MEPEPLAIPSPVPPPPAVEYRRLLRSLRDDRRSAQRHIEVARFLVRLNNHHRALSSLRVARALQPRRVQAYLLLGYVYRRIGDLPQAVVAYQQLLRIDGACRAAHFQLGTVLLTSGRHAEAATHLQRVVELAPSARKAYRLLATIADEAGDAGRALGYLEHVAALDDANAAVFHDIGRIHRKAGRPDRAIIALNRAIELDERQVAARCELAELLLDENVPDRALALVTAGLLHHGQHLELRLLEGRCHRALGQVDRELAALTTAARSAPEDFRPHLALGKCYAARGDFDLAEDALHQAMAFAAREHDVYRSLASLYLKGGKPDRAEATLVALTDVFPASPESWRLLGELRERIQKLDEAVAAFTRAIELAPADATLFCARARVHVKRGEYDDAVADFQRARELDPESEEAKSETDLIRGHKNYREALEARERAQSAREQGDFEGARKHFEHMLSLVPTNTRWLDEHARLSIICGDTRAAVASLERLLAIDDGNAAVAHRLGALFSAMNRFDDAWRMFERCVNIEPMNVAARIRIIQTLGHRAIGRSLSPDKFPRFEQAYRAGLAEPAKMSLAHLELGWLYLSFGSQIFPVAEWQDQARCHFTAVGERCSDELQSFRHLGTLVLARRAGADDEALGALVRLCELVPTSESHALGLLEYLKSVGHHARGFRLAEQFAHRFPGNGLIRALTFEFFVNAATGGNDRTALCRKRIQELQRRVASQPDDAAAYVDLALALMILSPAGERFESGRKVVVALNRARALQPDNPWIMWALLRETLRTAETSSGRRPDEAQLAQATTICRNGLRLFPDFTPFLEHLGRTQLASSDPVDVDRGRATLERAVIADGSCSAALFALGRHYEGLNDGTSARLYYAKVLESPRGTHFAKLVLERLPRLVS